MWVRSKYASELAVLSAWVSMLVPWSLTYLPREEGNLVFLRFSFFELQFRAARAITIRDNTTGEIIGEGDLSGQLAALYPGTQVISNFFVTSGPTSALFYENGQLQQASILYTIATVAFLVAFGLSLALYFREAATRERLPVSEVRLMGGLLGAGALLTAGASVLYYFQRDMVGIPIPIGVLIIGALATVLLRIEHVDESVAED